MAGSFRVVRSKDEPAQANPTPDPNYFIAICILSSFRDGPKDQTSDVRLHIGESRDSGFEASPRSQTRQLARRGMTTVSRQTLFCRRLQWPEVPEPNAGPPIRHPPELPPHPRQPPS